METRKTNKLYQGIKMPGKQGSDWRTWETTSGNRIQEEIISIVLAAKITNLKVHSNPKEERRGIVSIDCVSFIGKDKGTKHRKT